MSESYERYVRPATMAVLAANYGVADPTTEALLAGDLRIALAAVAPLIAEDARVRIVAAAAAAVERDGGECSALGKVRELHAARKISQPSRFTAWCDECSCAWPCRTAAALGGQS